ncbi:MAG TPA: hypothetical protein VL122_08850 [Nitrospirota bacterium]|nr:hypothetical protein [Nitrospirota bacterium]
MELLRIDRSGKKFWFCLSALPVTENLDVFCDILDRFVLGSVVAVMEKFLFECSQKFSIGALS